MTSDAGGSKARAIAILFGVVLLDMVGFGIVIPILPFLSPELGADKLDIAYIVAIYAIGAGLCSSAWGRLSDRIGRKPVIIICLAGAAASYVLLAFSTELWMVYVSRAFAGAMAGNVGVASAMMADMTRPEDRARAMGYIGAALGMGMVLGPMMGGFLSGPQPGFTLPCVVAGGMSVLAIIAAALFLPESLPQDSRGVAGLGPPATKRESTYQLLRRGGNGLLVLQFALHSICVSSLTYLFPLWAGDTLSWGPREVGVVFGIQGALMALVQGGLLGVLVRNLGELQLLRLSVSALFIGLTIGTFATSMPVMVGSIFIAMTGATLCIPLLTAVVSHRTQADIRGQMLGIASAAGSWGRVAGPLLAGINLELLGYHGAWFGTVCVSLPYLAWCYREHRRAGYEAQGAPVDNRDEPHG